MSYCHLIRLLQTILLLTVSSSLVYADTQPVLFVQNVPDRRVVDVRGKAELAVFDEFLRQNPGIQLRKAVPLRLEGGLGESSDYMAFAGGSAPDVLLLFLRKVPNFMDQDFLLPLDGYLTEQWIKDKDVPHQLWNVVTRDGHRYGVINDYYTMGLIYRKDLLRQEGLELRAPRDWDEFYYYAQRLTYPEKAVERVRIQRGQYGLLLASGQLGGWIWTSFVWGAGGEMVHHFKVCPDCGHSTERPETEALQTCENCGKDISDKMIPEQWKAVYDSKAGIMALNFYKKLRWSTWTRCSCGEPLDINSFDYRTGLWTKRTQAACSKCGQTLDFTRLPGKSIIEGVVRLENADIHSQLFYGEVAMTIGIPSQQLFEDAKRFAVRPADIGFTTLPVGPSGKPVSFIGGAVYSLNSTSKPEIRDEAWKYLSFIAGSEAEKIRTKVYVENGYANLVAPKLLQKFGYTEQYNEIPKELIEAYEQMETFGKVEPTCPQYQNVQTTYLTRPIDNVLLKPAADPSVELRNSADEVNKTVFRLKVEGQEKSKRFWGTLVIALVLLLTVIAGLRAVLGLAASYKVNKALGTRLSLRQHIYAWAFMMPALASVFVWQYVPLFRGSLMAFFDYRLLDGMAKSPFVWADNFFEALTDQNFWIYILQTFYYVGLTLGIGFLAPIFLALLLAEVPKGKMFFRVLFYLPAVTTGIVIMFLWKKLLYDPSKNGVLNQLAASAQNLSNFIAPYLIYYLPVILIALLLVYIVNRCMLNELLFQGRVDVNSSIATTIRTIIYLAVIVIVVLALHLFKNIFPLNLYADFAKSWLQFKDFKAINWLSDPYLAMLCIVIPGVWAGAGPGSIIYLAALKCVPNELYEAAEIDGASIRHKVIHVAFPILKPLIIINFVGAFIGSFRAMENIFVMTGGGPGTSTRTVGIEIWVQAFLNLRFGYATALAWILGAGLIGFTMYQLRILKNVEFRAADQAAAKGGV